MKALVLAAGYATRLYPLTKDRPKPLLPLVGERTILDMLVEELETLPGLDRIFVVTNHRFAGHFAAWARKRESLPGATHNRGLRGSQRDSEEELPLSSSVSSVVSTSAVRKPLEILDDGTDTPENRLGAIGDAAWTIRQAGIDDTLLIAAADNLFPFRFRDYADFAADKGTDCITCCRLDDAERLKRTGIVAVSDDGRVTRFEEKSPQPWSDLAVPPAYLYRRETLPLFAEYLAGGNNPDAPGNFLPWLLARRPVYAYRLSQPAMDIGTPESYEDARRRLGNAD